MYLRRDENTRGGFSDDAFSVPILISRRSCNERTRNRENECLTWQILIWYSGAMSNDIEISSCNEVSYSIKLEYEMCDDYLECPLRAWLTYFYNESLRNTFDKFAAANRGLNTRCKERIDKSKFMHDSIKTVIPFRTLDHFIFTNVNIENSFVNIHVCKQPEKSRVRYAIIVRENNSR